MEREKKQPSETSQQKRGNESIDLLRTQQPVVYYKEEFTEDNVHVHGLSSRRTLRTRDSLITLFTAADRLVIESHLSYVELSIFKIRQSRSLTAAPSFSFADARGIAIYVQL
ncbi:UNVERIFIED_CONTAM: hypothetical protein FKN15_028640 [Acipenser sinensis]